MATLWLRLTVAPSEYVLPQVLYLLLLLLVLPLRHIAMAAEGAVTTAATSRPLYENNNNGK